MADEAKPTHKSMRKNFSEDEAAQNPITGLAIGGVLIAIGVLLFLNVLPSITSAVATAQDDGNLSTAASNILSILDLTLAASVVAAGIAFMVRSFNGVSGR